MQWLTQRGVLLRSSFGEMYHISYMVPLDNLQDPVGELAMSQEDEHSACILWTARLWFK